METPSPLDAPFAEAFLVQARHYLAVEYKTKLHLAVASLPSEAVWWRPNDSSNSVGNLLLHLAGNLGQWIVSGVGGRPDNRNRAAEFAAREGESAEVLLAHLDRVLADVDAVLAGLTPEMMPERRMIQGRELAVFDAVFHVVEHFSYHLGQIVLVAKSRTPDAVLFYEAAGGLARPVWKDHIR